MKLIRFGNSGYEKPGIVNEKEQRIDVSSFCNDFDEEFFATDGPQRLKSWLKTNADKCSLVQEHERWAAPIARPSKTICVGLNYAKHAAESGFDLPKEPVIFFKSTTAIVGPYDDIIIPKGSTKTDWEVELAVVIGKKASYVEKEKSMEHVAGYVLHNDVSERDFQLERSGQWVKGKSCDTFAPIGPWVLPSEDIPDPHQLDLWLKVNGEFKQQSNTSDMIFKIPEIISYLSQFMTLLPGDVISTGTPYGVGMGLKPQEYLKPGDIVELGIDHLGSSKQSVKALS